MKEGNQSKNNIKTLDDDGALDSTAMHCSEVYLSLKLHHVACVTHIWLPSQRPAVRVSQVKDEEVRHDNCIILLYCGLKPEQQRLRQIADFSGQVTASRKSENSMVLNNVCTEKS